MTMIRFAALALSAAPALLAASPAHAQGTATPCVQAQYTDADRTAIEGFVGGFDISSGVGNIDYSALMPGMMEAIQTCAAKNEWDDQRIFIASMAEIGRVAELGFRKKIFSADEQARMETQLATPAGEEVMQVFEAMSLSMIGLEEFDVTPQQLETMGQFLIDSGIGEDKAEAVGAYMAAIALQRVVVKRYPTK